MSVSLPHSFDSASEYEEIVEYINFPLPPSERPTTTVATDEGPGASAHMDGGEGTDGGAALGSEMQKPDSELQTSPQVLENEPPQVGPESAVPSVSELQAAFTVEGEPDVEHPSGQDYLRILATEAPSEERVKEEEKENGNVGELTAKLNEQLSSPSLAKPKENVPPPPPKKPSHTLIKSTSQEPVKSPPGSGDIKKRASQLQKLLSGKEEEEKEEELMPTSSEKTPNSPLIIHQETKSRKVTPLGSKKPMKPAPKPPVSPKSAKKNSLGERSGKQISQGSLQDEQPQSPPSPPPHSPPTHQAPQMRTVTEDNPSKEYEARLPLIKKKIAERREQQQKESALAGPLGTPEIPAISHTGPSPTVSPESSPPPPPPPPRQRAPSSPLHSQSQLVSSSSPPPPPPRHSSPTPPPSPLHHRKQMPLPSSPPHQDRMPPPTYTPPPPPSFSTQEQTADQGVPASQFSVDAEETLQPPLPQRTSEMFLVQAPPGDSGTKQESPQHTGKKTNIKEVEEKGGEGKGKKRRFYQDVVLPKLKKVLGNSKEEKEKEKEKGKEKKDVEEKQEKEIQVKSPSFMNMRQRPLPAEPFAGTDEAETEYEPWEYEPIDTAEMLKQRPVAYATHFSPSHSFSPPFSHRSPSPSPLGAYSNSPTSVRRTQSFQPFDTRQTGAQRDARAYKYPSPPFLTRIQTVQQNTSLKSENGAVDDDGYVDTESSPPGKSFPEYDYPDTRAFRTLPNRMGKAPMELPPRNAGRSMTRTLSASSDYVPMTSAVDDSYINWEMIGSIRTQLLSPEQHSPPTVPTKSGRPPPRFVLDDLATVYMNLPLPEKPLVLPPRRQEREQQPTLQTVPGNSLRPIPSPRMPRPPACESPSTAKKPKPRPRAKTNISPESNHCTPVAMVTQVNPVTSLPPSTSSISEEMDLLRPKCSPNPRHPQLNRAEEIMISSSLPPSFGDSFGESFGGFSHHFPPEVSRRKLSDHGANEPQTISLPPRNILRQKKKNEEML